MSFYLFFIFPDLKQFLLKEIELYHPALKLSFSNKEFISMKGPADYADHLSDNPVIFAKRMGIFLDKSEDSQEFSIEVKKNQFWNYQPIKTSIDTFNLREVVKPKEAPARAWHKIQEFCELFKWEISEGDSIIEIGSAPGGISHYLLERKAALLVIDPADMNPHLKGFKHIKKSIFDVSRQELPTNCDWIISDLNLHGDLNLSQCKRIADYYPRLNGGFITIKTPKPEDLKNILKWKKTFEKFKVDLFHLPAHRKEIGLIFKK